MKIPWHLRPAVALVAGLGGLFTCVRLSSAQPWATSGIGIYGHVAVAASADGLKLAVAGWRFDPYGPTFYPTPIYASTNSGATWASTGTPTNFWSAFASSADGAKLIAASVPPSLGRSGNGPIYASTNGGATWSLTSAPTNNWSALASSADGSKLFALVAPYWSNDNTTFLGGSSIYRSLDSGATWAQTSAPSDVWSSIATSADGTKLAAVASADAAGSNGLGPIYVSADSGTTWTRTSAPSYAWSTVAISANGTKLVAAASSDATGENGTARIYISADSGTTWTRTSAPTNIVAWLGVASSADGATLVAAAQGLSVSINRLRSDLDFNGSAASLLEYRRLFSGRLPGRRGQQGRLALYPALFGAMATG
jgi:hypothetical protein